MRTGQRIHLQAPARHLDQLRRELAVQALEVAFHLVFDLALVGRLRRRAGHAGVHRRADTVDVRPRPQRGRFRIQFGRCKAGRVHWRQFRHVLVEGLARRAEVEHDRHAIGAQIDIRGLQVQVQQFVGVYFAQARAHAHEDLADERFGQATATRGQARNVLLQRVARFIGHHHVHRVVGAEEVQHPHHVRVGDQGQRPAFFEKAFQPDPEHRQVGFRNDGQ